VYRASGTRADRPIVRNNQRQIGWYQQKGGDSVGILRTATTISGDVTNLAKAIVANYLALHGEEGRLNEVVGDNPFGANLDQYLAFNKMT
jgi:hypothetical protein